MQEQTTQYRTNHVTFELPSKLKVSRASITIPSSPAVPFDRIAALQTHLDRTAGV